MKLLVALAAFTPSLIGAASPVSERPWRIVRNDYVEFCAGTTLTWDLHEGTLKKAKGACIPHKNAPPTITVTGLSATDVKRLRRLSEAALRQGITTQPCNGVQPASVFSGPIYFKIQKGGLQVQSTNCLNALGHRLENAIAASIDRAINHNVR